MGIGGRDLVVLRPRDTEALLDEEAFDRDEFMPYWAELWPSALALARVIGTRQLKGARTLEIGCGLGLPSLGAAAAGGRVTATDWAADAIAMLARNAARNGLTVEGLAVSWTEPAPLLERAPWDIVLASDVLYEPRNGEALLPLLPMLIERGEIWLADPGRTAAGPFLEARRGHLRDRDATGPRDPSGCGLPHASERLRGMSTQREKAEELRRLHAAPEPLVLVNAWDAASARVVASTPGCRAIATASWSIAAARGYRDGEEIPLNAMLQSVATVAKAVDLPVTADLERGYGDAGATIAAALEAGAVGCNLEDSDGSGLIPAELHAANVAAARAAGEANGIPLVINARTDVYLAGDKNMDEAVERARAYLAAGADCAFIPGVGDLATLEELVRRVRGPISILARPGQPAVGRARADRDRAGELWAGAAGSGDGGLAEGCGDASEWGRGSFGPGFSPVAVTASTPSGRGAYGPMSPVAPPRASPGHS